MFRTKLLAFCVPIIFIVYILCQTSTAQCKTNCHWFGSSNYLCHCANNAACDANTGDCPGECDDGWFGPACQFVSINHKVDDNASFSCSTNNNGKDQSITVTLDTAILLTWIRLVVNDTVKNDGIQIECIGRDKAKNIPCPMDQITRVDSTTLDISCPTSDVVSKLTLSGSGVRGLCSLYISGGHNIALKAIDTAQSTGDPKKASTGVDGLISTSGVSHCTHTQSKKYNPPPDPAWWTLTFSGMVNINKIDIYNRIDCCKGRLTGFTLNLYGESDSNIFSYTENYTKVQDMYPIANIGVKGVKKIEIILPKNSKDNVLTLCEVVVLGACSAGSYGVGCTEACSLNCAGNGGCNHIDRSCDKGCKPGFMASQCDSLSIGYTSRNGSNDVTWLTDNNHTTCNAGSVSPVTITLNTPIILSSIRIMKASDHKAEIIFEYNVGGVRIVCSGNDIARIDDKTVDIACPTYEKVNELTLSGSGIGELCSLYINGGHSIALKEANIEQSSTYSGTLHKYAYAASYAVDGHLPSDASSTSCTHTDAGQGGTKPAWWTLTFSNLVYINRIDIYNRDGNRDRLKGFTLKIYDKNNDEINSYIDTETNILLVYNIWLNGVRNVNKIEIVLPVTSKENILTLCEVIVYGDTACEVGKYGDICDKTCYCAHQQPCTVSSGVCPSGCADGYTGNDCSTGCSTGYYGQNCTQNCSDHCVGDDDSCHHISGYCDLGCDSGYQPPLCTDVCSTGNFGQNCSLNCSSHCAGDDKSCHHQSGYCNSGCEPGYQPPLCVDGCSTGYYGQNCTQNCSDHCVGDDDSCHHISGYCDLGCDSGYQPPLCTDVCSTGNFGQNCSLNCSSHCAGDDKSCHHQSGYCNSGCEPGYQPPLCVDGCSTGYYGQNCTQNCSDHCVGDDDSCHHISGYCDLGCDSGYQPPLCTDVCSTGNFGQNCSLNCSSHCAGDDKSCHHQSGYCNSGCEPGYQPPLCVDGCSTGYYGQNCTQNCSDHCVGDDDSCHHISGYCDLGCDSGYQPPLCTDVCSTGNFGQNCSLNCSSHCAGDDKSCHHQSGYCNSGCEPGYQPPLCVDGCSTGYYGQNCTQNCSDHCVGDDDSCHHISGYCDLGCDSGYQPPLCTDVCSTGNFGQNCSLNCSSHCAGDDKSCHHQSGYCNSGCEPGYQPPLCVDGCSTGYYGQNCTQNCSDHCVGDDDSCHHISGYCDLGCDSGYQPPLCTDVCSTGNFGQNCSLNCSSHCAGDDKSCHHQSGYCNSGCEPGYQPPLCVDGCSTGYYGQNCTQNCSDHCVGDDDSCHHISGYCDLGCDSGYQPPLCTDVCSAGNYGQNCSLNCSSHCVGDDKSCHHQSGYCNSGCEPGYQPPLCIYECDTRQYGQNCSKMCSEFCVGDENRCNHRDGSCDCEKGYQPGLCENACDGGKYGQDCSETCSDHCFGETTTCHHVTGSCEQGCKPGYELPLCKQECPEGSHGRNCTEQCSEQCGGDGLCHHMNGSCYSGCQSGYALPLCTQKLSGGGVNGSAIGAAVGAVFGILIIIAVVAGIFFWRRRKLLRDDSTAQNSAETKRKDMELSSISTPRRPSRSKRSDAVSELREARKPSIAEDTAVPVADLKTYLLKHAEDSLLQEQFKSVPMENQTKTSSNGSMPENKKKNRFTNILPYDDSRVILSVMGDDPHSDYINASHIPAFHNSRKIIASQGPNDFMMNDFIRMLWEQNVEQIVMLTNLVEQYKRKCSQYWPMEGVETFGDISVELLTTRVYADYTIRHMKLLRVNEATRALTQYHFTVWPDKGVPHSPWGLVDLYHRTMAGARSGTLLVHCSAGVGRTGTFIALHHLMTQAEVEDTMDFLPTLKRLRAVRPQMVQTAEQYKFLHQTALISYMSTDLIIPVRDLFDKLQDLNDEAGAEGSGFTQEFTFAQLCGELVSNHEETDINSISVKNKDKNRLSNILANKLYRPVLGDDGNVYINAVLVPVSSNRLRKNFTQDKHDLITQLPLPSTVTDLWRLVTDYQVSLMVVFDTEEPVTDETIGTFLPCNVSEVFEDEVADVTLKHKEETRLWNELRLAVNKKQDSDTEQAKPKYITCMLVKTTELNPERWLAIINKAQSRRPAEKSRCLYMCRNGATLSGLACVLSILLDRLEIDRCLAVPFVVGAIKAVRPQVIPTVAQYKLLYEVLRQAHEDSNEYCNVDNGGAVMPIKNT